MRKDVNGVSKDGYVKGLVDRTAERFGSAHAVSLLFSVLAHSHSCYSFFDSQFSMQMVANARFAS